ncbi:MAG: diadenylate cyclase CdaA [Candidatus Avispirillum sp.]
MTFSGVGDFFSTIFDIIRTIKIVDVIDILLVSVILYYAYKFVRDRRAGKLAAGVILFIIALVISDVAGMHTIQYLFQNIFQVGVIALVILFQPELRSALEKMGNSSIKGIKSITERSTDSVMLAVREVASAAAEMSASRTGALIVFERSTKLGDIVMTGTVIDAQTGSFLIRNIFFNKAPLHDGAMIIRAGRIVAAGCLLPLTGQGDINRDLGTRHRAAIGLSENSDAVVVVVSEETGVISLAVDGKLTRGYSAETLRAKLSSLLVPETEKKTAKKKAARAVSADEAPDGDGKPRD